MMHKRSIFLILMIVSITACSTTGAEITQATPTTQTIIPTAVVSTFTCADVDEHWGNDWPTTLEVLDQLIHNEETCGEEPLLSKKYAAHFIYANSLETSGEIENAIANYTSAFLIDANRAEALNALSRLEALPEPTAVPCNSDIAPLPDPSPREQADASMFVQSQDNKLVLQNQPFQIRGVNYYPRKAPWHQFLIESELSDIETELDLIHDAGFNTIRIFLWYEPLFICQPEDAIPSETMFAKVDSLIQLAKERDLHLIVTLNDLPDLTFRPLYTDWERYDAQTRYIVRRYQNESAILAWDLRNEGDLDYGAREGDEPKFSQEIVIDWLEHINDLVEQDDPHHLKTAGWWGDPTITEPYVDFLSFHHWYDVTSLEMRVNDYIQQSEKPILIEEIGYHSWQDAPQDKRNDETQAVLLSGATEFIENEDLAGWVVWTAFDFVPKPGQSPNYEHYFGLWRSDLSPKPALDSIFENE